MASPSPLFREQLHRVGLRATPARLAVLEHLLTRGLPTSHAELCELLGEQAWDRATVYRSLTQLAEAGLLSRVDPGDRIWRYGLTTHNHIDATHPHFLCTDCGDISCLPEAAVTFPDVPGLPNTVKNGKVELQLRGICDACTESDQRA